MNAIEVHHVSKSYGTLKALDDVSFTVGKGEVFGLIGPDGAGKTSMYHILCTLLKPGQGRALVDGFDTVKQMTEIRSRVGYMPGKFSLYQDLTVQENLEFFATFYSSAYLFNSLWLVSSWLEFRYDFKCSFFHKSI